MHRLVACSALVGASLLGAVAVTADGPARFDVRGASPSESAVRVSCPEAGDPAVPGPAPVAGDVRSFTDDEFQRLVDLASPAGISDLAPPPILGDPVADARIRSLAEARGYRRRADHGVAGLVSVGGRLLDPPTATAWRAMVADAAADGVGLLLHSAYRSELRQRQIFLGKLGARGHGTSSVRSGRADAAVESILRFSSIPGYSRHHTGRVVDVVSPGFGLSTFHRSAGFAWLSADGYRNARRHGFVPSYPPGAGRQGPEPEPWEFVHVGLDALRSWSDLASVDQVTFGIDQVTFVGSVPDPDAVVTLHVDERPVASITGRCSPGVDPGAFRLTAGLTVGDDLCLVQTSSVQHGSTPPGRRLVGCGP